MSSERDAADVRDSLPVEVGPDGLLAEKYRILRKLGQGGMGSVYEVEHDFLGRKFAVKFLRPEYARDKEMLARFKREARTAAAIESENIAAVVDFGESSNGVPFIVMELLKGQNLRDLLEAEGQLPVPRALNLVIQACRGLRPAHEQQIVHRDLKPENLFVVRRGDGGDLLKILDFGIAKLRGAAGATVSTQDGTLMGTLSYMPMEQARGDKDIDHGVDIFALGAILYEALSGTVPHPGGEPHVVLYHLVHTGPKFVSELRPGLPDGLAEVVHRAIAKNRSDRYRTVRELADALAVFTRQGRGVSSVRADRSPRVEGPIASAETSVAPPESRPRPAGEPKEKSTQVQPRPEPADRARGVGGVTPETQPPVVASGDTARRGSWRGLGVIAAAGAALLLGVGVWWSQRLSAPVGGEVPADEAAASAELAPAAPEAPPAETPEGEPEKPIVRPVSELAAGAKPTPSVTASATTQPSAPRAASRPTSGAAASRAKSGTASSTVEHAAKGKKRAVRFDTASPY